MKSKLTLIILMLISIASFAQQNGVTGQPVPPTSTQIAGSDGTNLRTVKTDTTGALIQSVGATTSSSASVSGCNILSAASTNSTNCKATTGNFYGYDIHNTTTTVYYLRLYDLAAAPTCSSATGFIRTIPIQPASAAGGVGGEVNNITIPVNFVNGFGYCITAGSSSTDNTAAATGIFGEIRFK